MYKLDRHKVELAMRDRGVRSLKQLAGLLGLHRNTIQGYFAGRGVVSKNLEAMLIFLRLELKDVLLHERKSKTEDALIAKVVDRLTDSFPQWTFVLFGSRARQQHQQYADLDIGVFSHAGIEHAAYRRLLREKSAIEESLPIFVDVVNLSRADSDFLQSISQDWTFLAGKRQDWLLLQEKVRGLYAAA